MEIEFETKYLNWCATSIYNEEEIMNDYLFDVDCLESLDVPEV